MSYLAFRMSFWRSTGFSGVRNEFLAFDRFFWRSE
ncbi:hypothetical protein HNO89_002070 [Sporosarcina luteola]|nr:hypothetical protein [Sporosarcina luteola]